MTTSEQTQYRVTLEGTRVKVGDEPVSPRKIQIIVTDEAGVTHRVGQIHTIFFLTAKAQGLPYDWADGWSEELGRVIEQLFSGAELYSGLRLAYKLRASSFLLVEWLEIQKEWRRKGVGTLAMKALFDVFNTQCGLVVSDTLKSEDESDLSTDPDEDDPAVYEEAKRVRAWLASLGFRRVSDSFLAYGLHLQTQPSPDEAAGIRVTLKRRNDSEHDALAEDLADLLEDDD